MVREQPRLRKTLVVVQVALSFLMIVAAGLFVRSLDNLLRVHPGFSTAQVTSFTVDLERSGYGKPRSALFGRELLERLEALPGVEAAGFATLGILEGGGWGMGFTVEGYTPKPGDAAGSLVNAVSPGFFEALQAPIVRGRALHDAGRAGAGHGRGLAVPHAVVNETFAKRYFAGRDPDRPARRHRRRSRHADADHRSSASSPTASTRRSARTRRPQVFLSALREPQA